jgi:hypothetical protein
MTGSQRLMNWKGCGRNDNNTLFKKLSQHETKESQEKSHSGQTVFGLRRRHLQFIPSNIHCSIIFFNDTQFWRKATLEPQPFLWEFIGLSKPQHSVHNQNISYKLSDLSVTPQIIIIYQTEIFHTANIMGGFP